MKPNEYGDQKGNTRSRRAWKLIISVYHISLHSHKNLDTNTFTIIQKIIFLRDLSKPENKKNTE